MVPVTFSTKLTGVQCTCRTQPFTVLGLMVTALLFFWPIFHLLLRCPPSGGSSYLQEVLHAFGVVAVALPADPLHLLDLAGLAGCLDVLEVHLGVLAEVHDGTQEVEQT